MIYPEKHKIGILAIATLCCISGASGESLDMVADTIMQLPQVSVTAIKSGRSRGVVEVSSRFSQAEIERLNVVNVKQVSELVPNFFMPQYGSRMTSSVYVRGLGTRIDQPVVGLNIDGVSVLNKDNFDFDMSDIESVEILRGPANVLYGRNTMGGVINISTLSPLKYQGVRLLAEYASRNSYKATAGIYKSVHSRLGMALNLYASGTDGFFRNSYNGSSCGRERQMSARWKTVWNPRGEFVLQNTASVIGSRQNGYPYQSVESGLIAYNDTCFYRRISVFDGLTINGRVGNVALSAIGSFQYINDNMTLDQDFLPVDYFTLTQKRHEWAATIDLVAKSKPAGAYDWLIGIYGFAKRANMFAPVTFHDYGLTHIIEKHSNDINPAYPIKWDNRTLPLDSRFTLPTIGASVYHQSTVALGRFDLSLGLRYDWERVSLQYNSDTETSYTIYRQTHQGPVYYHGPVPIDIHNSGKLSKVHSQLLPRVALSFKLPGKLGCVFASITKGYKSGGYNTQMFSDVLQQDLMRHVGIDQRYDVDDVVAYAPEQSWNYEIGTRLWLFNRRLHLEGNLFWIECRNQQLTMFPEGSITGRIMSNAGRSRSRGLEFAATVDVATNLTARVSYGLTDARFTSFGNGRVSYNGNHVPYAPLNTLFVSMSYGKRFASGFINRISADINCRGVGKIYWNETNNLSQPFYAIADVSVRAWHGNLSAEIWVNNFTNTQYATYYFVSIEHAFLQRGNGVQAGATLRYEISL